MKTKALISFAVTAKLICAFVFAYANCWFSHARAILILLIQQLLLYSDSFAFSSSNYYGITQLICVAIEFHDFVSIPISQPFILADLRTGLCMNNNMLYVKMVIFMVIYFCEFLFLPKINDL